MDLSIIIVNWNSKDYLKKCIASILTRMRTVKFEIVVIDSGSFDGVGEMLQNSYPQVRFLQSGRNIGFARANNTAFRASSGRNILFMNPDTEINDFAIETLCYWLDALPNAGIVGAKLLNSDRSVQTSCIQAFPNILNQLFDSNALRGAFPRAIMWGTRPLFMEGNSPAEVDAISGACLMIKKSVFEAVQMFSTDYFMYSEDIDLCFKVRKAGRQVYYIPTAVVVHHGGTSSSQTDVSTFSSVMMLESSWRFFRKTRPFWYCWFYRLTMCIASMLRVGVILSVWPYYVLRGESAAVRNAMKKWIAKLRWTLGGESWVKNY